MQHFAFFGNLGELRKMAAIKKVLILDENDSNVLFFEMLLSQMEKDFQIFTASAGAHAELLVKDQKIQMVICAWEMSTMPGTVFVQRIRQNKHRRYIPCLIFSKRMGTEDIELTKELGFKHILGMPFDKQSAKDMLMEIINYEENLSSDEKKIRKIESLIADGLITEALKFFDNKLTQKGDFKTRARLALAEIWIQSRNFEKAEEILNQILGEESEQVDALKLLARLFSLTGRHDQAIETLEGMTKKSPKNMNSLLCLGSAYVDAERHDKAREVFGRVEGMDKDNSELKDEQGKLAFKEGDLPLAAQLLAETQGGDELVRHFNNVAIAKVAGGLFEEAIATYKNAIQLLTDKAKLHQLHYNLGLAWKKKGDLNESFNSFCESYINDPTFEKAYTALAKTSKELKSSGNKLDADLVAKVKSVRQQYKESHEKAS